jgi:hypothetical protein
LLRALAASRDFLAVEAPKGLPATKGKCLFTLLFVNKFQWLSKILLVAPDLVVVSISPILNTFLVLT